MSPPYLARKLYDIDVAYQALLATGFPLTLDGIDETLQVARDVDRTNWLTFMGMCDEAVMAGAPDDLAAFPIRCTSNTNHAVTYAQGAQIVRDLRLWAGAAQANWWALKDAARAATTAQELRAVDPSQGWP